MYIKVERKFLISQFSSTLPAEQCIYLNSLKSFYEAYDTSCSFAVFVKYKYPRPKVGAKLTEIGINVRYDVFLGVN